MADKNQLILQCILLHFQSKNSWLGRRKRLLKFISAQLQRRRTLLKLHSYISRNLCEEHKQKIVKRKKRCRRFPKNTGWWDQVQQCYDEGRFKQTFRVSRETFDFIVSRIKDDIAKKETAETPLSPEMRLAVCLYKLSRGDYNFTVAEMMGIGESTVISIVNEVCEAIIVNLWEESVTEHFPNNQECFNAACDVMNSEWQFCYAFSAIDGSHVPIKCPPGGAESMKQYHNFKNFYSIILLALVDAKYRFIWASSGAPGNTHDSTLFQSTNLWSHIVKGELLNHAYMENDIAIPPVILGDGAFPMRTWLLKPYGDAVLQ